MTASPADNLARKGLSRNLTLRFSALLFLFLALWVGSYIAVSSVVSAKEYDSVIVNLAGRQRMLTQKYAREINQVLVALAVSDRDMAVEMKEAACQTAGVYEETLAAFLAGGDVDAGEEGRIWIPPVQGDDLVEHLGHVKTQWEHLRRTALLAMRSGGSSLAGNDNVRNIQTRTAKAVAVMDHAVLLMQKQSEARLHRVGSYMVCACILSAMLFVGTVVYVHTKIVVPLEHSMTALKTEVTDRKQAEHEVRKLSAAVEQSPATVVITDTEGTIQYVNPRFTETTGYTAEEAIGQNPRVLKSGDMPPETYRRMWETILAGQTWRGEFQNKKKNGEPYWEAASISPIRNSEGAITHFLAVKEEITERKQAEEKLHEGNAMLIEAVQREKRVSMELEGAMQQLEAATHDARAATQAKSEFLANMSHEIRTPMTAILGYAELLHASFVSRETCPERAECMLQTTSIAHVETIMRNGEYLLRILNDILDLSKIEAGKLEVEHVACSPRQVISDVAALMRVRAAGKGLDFRVHFDGPVPESIQSDAMRLRQILINLVGNAVKFTEAGSVRLTTRCLNDTEDPKLQCDIADTGIGLSQDQADGLFQPFTQADASTSRKFGGTGLGLTISRRLAQMLGGEITLESTPGAGSTFRLTIATGPLDGVKMIEHPDEAPTQGAPGLGRGVAPEPAQTLPDCRILLAEDGHDNQRLISFILTKAGANVTVVENGQLAVEKAAAAEQAGAPFDVILMDMQMPVMDGYLATRLLRRKGYTRPIVALTAHAMSSDREKCIQAGCDDYAAKPIERDKLIEIIRRFQSDGVPPRSTGQVAEPLAEVK